ncbi:hypothetical protein O181_011527 [Austropuccinia psidii MF-1]|uniref:Uncharacterized protein n=1 Tax=Austropuccinia psidii MF-1 TaxID=1389203 RepID=A0A9Q3BVW2_9BASI|nr:hypothetical protein [Austropuccinia psidii MF-1]
MRRISDSPIDPNAEGSDEIDGEEAEVAPNSIGHQSSTLPYQPSSKRFQIQVIPSTPETPNQLFLPFHHLLLLLPLPGLAWFNQGDHHPFHSPEISQWSPPNS